jgi:hypothetical protein
MAQNEDDLYFVPSKDKTTSTDVNTQSKSTVKTVKRNKPTTVVVTNSQNNPTTVIVRRSNNSNTRNIDEYNRRYNSTDNGNDSDVNGNSYDNGNGAASDTLYIDDNNADGPQNRNGHSSVYDQDLDGNWVNGFDGTDDDYEYATRIIRFRNPRFAINMSSPYYWDVVYGLNSWDWNVYYDGMYAYAFPTFSNRLWWDWRFNSYGWGFGYNYGWGGYSPYYSYWGGGYPYYGGWHGRGWDGGYYAHRGGWYSPRWQDGGNHLAGVTYRNNRYSNYGGNSYTRGGNYGSSNYGGNPNGNSSRRYINEANILGGDPVRNSTVNSRRVIGTRQGETIRTDASSSRRESYDRPSSTRAYNGTTEGAGYSSRRGNDVSGYSNNGAYTRSFNQSESRRSYTPFNNSNNNNGYGSRRSYTPSNNNSNRSYSPGRSYNSVSRPSPSVSRGSFSGGGSRGGNSSGGGAGRTSRR